MKKLFSYKGGDPIEVKDFKEVQKFVAKEHGASKKQVAIHPIVFEDEEFSRGVVLLTKFGNIYALVGSINFNPEENE